MRKVFFIIGLLCSLASFGQTVTGDILIGRRSIYLRDWYVDSIKRDTSFNGFVRSIPTADAIYKFVIGRTGIQTISTSTPTAITGILKGNGGVVGAAAVGIDYVAPNASITGAQKTKITFDSKGLVTAGADATTSDIAEGSNQYFTTSRVLNTALTGYTAGSNTSLSATDNILGAMGKIQGQINSRVSGALTSGRIPIVSGATALIDYSNLTYDGSTLTQSGNTLAADKWTLNGNIANDNPTFIEFRRKQSGAQVFRGSIGALGSTEMNISNNMDYTDGTHKYYDSTKAAIWMHLGYTNGFGLQYTKAGHTNNETMWSTYGKSIFRVEIMPNSSTGEAVTGGSKVTTQQIDLVDNTYAAGITSLTNVGGVLTMGTTSTSTATIGQGTVQNYLSMNGYGRIIPSTTANGGVQIATSSSAQISNFWNGPNYNAMSFIASGGTAGFDDLQLYAINSSFSTSGLSKSSSILMAARSSLTNGLSIGAEGGPVRLFSGGLADANTKVTVDATNTTIDNVLKVKETTTPSTPSSTYQDIYPKSDGYWYTKNSAGTELRTAGGDNITTSNKTTAYSAAANDYTITCDATSGAFSVTLPTAVGVAGKIYIIKKMDSSGNAVTVATTSSQNIDASTTYSLSTQYKYVVVQSNNANWIIIGNN